MTGSAESPKLSILHVLTLNGRNGEYGGPVRVARELCTELNARGDTTQIFSGAREGSEPVPEPGLSEIFILVKPICRRFAISSVWSWNLVKPLKKLIANADIVHIHFARDLIPFVAATISILKKKPFVTQTHGMIVPDGRKSTRLIDFFLTRRLIRHSQVNFVLTDSELNSIRKLGIASPCRILPNGIAVNLPSSNKSELHNGIVFCARLEKRKGVGKFIDLADSFRESGFKFEIYGPDGGELPVLQREVISRNLNGILEYKGALPSELVHKMLRTKDILVLPSKNEPFPMVVLEALAVGTPVLVMPSCGLASRLKKFDSSFVAESEDLLGLIRAFNRQRENKFAKYERAEIIEFCSREFGISAVTMQLRLEYLKAVSRDR